MLTTHATDAMLADLIATGATFDPATLHVGIFSALVNNGAATAVADLTEDLTHYPRLTLTTWGTPYHLSDGSSVVDSAPKIFSGAGGGNSIRLIGFSLTDALTAGNLLEFALVTPPTTLNTSADKWTLVVRLKVDPSGNWDVSVFWNG